MADDELTVDDFASPLPPGVYRPCSDCLGRAVWLDAPAPNGARVLVTHDTGCPWFAAWRAVHDNDQAAGRHEGMTP